MKKYSEQLTYEISEDGYDIYLNGQKWIAQHEPYIPYPELGYEESCLKQCEELQDGVDPAKILQRAKDQKIKESKEKLESILTESYVEFEMHGSLKRFSITREKQNLLSALIQKKQYAEEHNISFHAMWNAKGEANEEYSLEELQILSVSIYNSAQLYVKKQQEIEIEIQELTDIEAVERYVICY